jgi:hypothetical protein
MKTTARTVLELGTLLSCAALVLFFLQPSSTEKKDQEAITKDSWKKSIVKKVSAVSKREVTNMSFKGYQKDKAYQGFTMYPESGSAKVYLVNMSGDIVHTWNFDGERVRLMPNCHVMVLHGTKWGLSVEPWKSLRNVIREYDWDGNLVWEFRHERPIHHDIALLPNGNIIGMQRVEVPKQIKQNATIPFFRSIRLRSDKLFEINRQGDEVWSWQFHEHVPLNSCGKFTCPQPAKRIMEKKREYDWTHMNTVGVIPPNHWYDEGDLRFKPGNIVIMPRNWSTAMIVDRESGKIVWEYTGDYKGGLSYGHEAHMIEPGLPGAGNILIFDNGEGRGESYALEINPVSQEVVWVYDAGREFFSKVAGSLQRFPNGNTLISEDVPGRVFEVSADKEVVWMYEGHHIRSARAHRYPPNHCPKLAELMLHSKEDVSSKVAEHSKKTLR